MAVPLSVVLHELGHLAAYRVLGIPGVVLHFSHVSGAGPDHPGWALATAEGAGPLATLAIVAICAILAATRGTGPATVALGLVAPFRVVVAAAWLSVHTVWGTGNSANFDELNLSRAMGWPAQPVILLELALVALALWWLTRALPPERRRALLASIILGGGLGVAAYWLALGPLLLP